MDGEWEAPLMLTSLDERSTIDDFDDTDYHQDSPGSSHHPVALESRIPNHLLLVSLLEGLVAAYEKDPNRRKKMFRTICRHLDDMNVIPSWEFIENFSSIRAQYSNIVHSMMMAVTQMMDKQAASKFLSLPSTADERSFALLGSSDPLSPRTPDIRREDVLKSHNSRYRTEFNEIEKIGKGGFGSVYKVKNKLDQREYAVKKIKLKQKYPESARKVLREVQLLASLDHANIVGYNAAWIEAEPVRMPETKVWTLPMEDHPVVRNRHGSKIKFNRSNSHGGESPPNFFTKPVIQSPPSTASTITATPRSPSNVHQSRKHPLTPEIASQTPKAVPRTTPEASFNQPRFHNGNDFAAAGRDYKANSVVKTKLLEIDESESVEINGTEFVETSRPRSNGSDPSKSGDSLDDILCSYGVHQDKVKSASTISRTDSVVESSFSEFKSTLDVDDFEVQRTTISSTYAKYEADEDELSIRFENSSRLDSLSSLETAEQYSSQVQSERVSYNYVSKRHTMEHSSHMKSSTEITDRKQMALLPRNQTNYSSLLASSGNLSGHFGHSGLSRKTGRGRLKSSNDLLESEDSSSKPLEPDIDGKLNLARRRQLGRRAVSFDPSSELSRGETGLLTKTNLFAGLSVVLYIQMQLCSRTLAGWLKERNEMASSLPDSFDGVHVAHNMHIFEGIMKGVQYIHSNGFMHRDLKPKNIFLEGDNLQVRIGDFGLARHDVVDRSKSLVDQDYPLTPFDTVNKWDFTSSSTMHTSGVGTATYASPEQLNGSDYDSKSDMYSAGIIFFELFHPFTTGMERAKCMDDLRQGHIASEVWKRWPKQSAIMEELVAASSKDRPTADEVLHSELFVSKDEMISSLQSQLTEQSKLLRQKQVELVERNAELRDARQLLKEKDALIYELLDNNR